MLTEKIKCAGVVGAGGAGFPTHVKLDTKAECFIVNAAECEPMIETDKFLCRNFADELISGVLAISEHLGAKRTVIALKRKYAKEVAAIEKTIAKNEAGIEIFFLDAFYPAGDEQVLVHMVTGRSVPERGIPIEVGAVVNNVATVLNVFNAIHEIPVTEKYLSVTGAVKRPVVLRVPMGTPVMECIDAAELSVKEYEVILGGPMMGKCAGTKEEIASQFVSKTTSNILILPKGHYLTKQAKRPMKHNLHLAQSACLQCRFCTQQCPRYRIGHDMEPHRIMRAIFMEPRINDRDEYARLYGGAMNCSECGVCEMFACPMGLSPRKVNVYLKKKLRERQLDIPKNTTPRARECDFSGRASTERLIARLSLMAYGDMHANDECSELTPERVVLSTSQHIGKPAVPIKKAGDKVYQGECVAAANGALSGNIHASIDGMLEQVDDEKITIVRA